MDVQKLLSSLEHDKHEDILEIDSKTIAENKNNILQQLQFDRTKLKEIHKKLKLYRYIDAIHLLKPGNWLRWFNIKAPDNIKLTNGAFFTECLFLEDECNLVLKSTTNRVFQIKFNECIIFQRLSKQEQIILGAIDLLNKS